MIDASETFTCLEISQALQRLHNAFSGITATAIANDIKAHREPKWETGDVVVDAEGVKFLRTSSGRWTKFGTTALFLHGTPVRPLRRMIVAPDTWEP
jgi:post-segregation antitoxin (ccd killing protein)